MCAMCTDHSSNKKINKTFKNISSTSTRFLDSVTELKEFLSLLG